MRKEAALTELVGKKIKEIKGLEKYSEEVRVFTEDGSEYLFHHLSECCESVSLNDFEVSAATLIGGVILSADLVESQNEGEKPEDYSDSWTWSFYKVETDKGGLWMRWLGESNGYYSESVNFACISE